MRRGVAVLVTLCWAVVLAACGASSASGTTTSSAPKGAAPATYEVAGDPLTIRTPDGVVHGEASADTRNFLGMPFARSPVGTFRWQAPQPVTPWTTTLDATTMGSECPQIVPVVNLYTGNENCLYLNVYAPKKTPTTPRPVMVWIYGGGFTVGSAGDDNVANFAADNDVISVSFNYRLGPLGFLALPALAAEDPHHSTGDLGLLDQQAALRWVRANIASFGGDPHNVTIFGESAGGISTCAQLVSPGSAGLFQKGITESGPCTLPTEPLSTAESEGAQLAAKLGCPADSALLDCMRSMPAQQVIEAMPPDPSFLFGDGAYWGPVADGVTLPTDPTAALEAGHFHHVPLIIGANRDEGRLFVALHYNVVGNPLTDVQWASAVDEYFGSGPRCNVSTRSPTSPTPGRPWAKPWGMPCWPARPSTARPSSRRTCPSTSTSTTRCPTRSSSPPRASTSAPSTPPSCPMCSTARSSRAGLSPSPRPSNSWPRRWAARGHASPPPAARRAGGSPGPD